LIGQCGGTLVDVVRIYLCASTIFLIYFCWIKGYWVEATLAAISLFPPFEKFVKRLNYVV
jgi:hypothetical protein